MNTILKARIILLLTFLIFSQMVFAQAKAKKKKNYFEWGNLGVGYSSKDYYSDFTSFSYSAEYNRTVKQIFIQGGIQGQLPNSGYEATLFDVHLAAGYGLGIKSRFMTAFSLGPGYMSGVTLPDSGYQYYYHTLGLAAVIQLIPKPAPDFGIGLEIFGNFNKYIQNMGLRLVIHISNNPNKEIKRELPDD